MGFAESFEKAYINSSAQSSQATLEAIKEKIKKEAETSEKATKLTALKSAGIQFSEQAISAGADPKVINMFADALSAQKDPDVAEKIYTAAITNAAQQQKDKSDFEQQMLKARYESSMLGVNEVIKSLAERGGTFEDGTPITSTSLQDFGKQASDRIINTMGIGQQIIEKSKQPLNANENTNTNSLLNTPISKKLTAEQEKVKSETATALDNFNSIMTLFKGSKQGVGEGDLASLAGFLTRGEYNTKGEVFKDVMPTVSSQIYMGVTGDTRLSDKDAAQRAFPLLPKQTDSPKKNTLKENFIRSTLEERSKRYDAGDFSPIKQAELMREFNKYLDSDGKEQPWSGKSISSSTNKKSFSSLWS